MGLVRVTFTLSPSVHVPVISIVRLLPVPCRFVAVMPLGKLMLARARVVGLALKLRVNTVVVVVFAVPLAVIDCRVTLVGGASLTVILKSWVKGVVAVKPFATVARICAVPALVTFRVLPLVIFAPVVPALCTLHVIVLFVALLGLTVPVSVKGVPTVAVVG